MNNLQLFMRLYMYELELWLNEHKDYLMEISFQSDEANTDRPLKEFLKMVIENYCCSIVALKNISFIEINAQSIVISDSVKNAYIGRVLLPEHITPQIKTLLQARKKAIFTKPDLCLEININGNIEYETIELKSTKSNSIPGSSVQQIMPDEWVVFVKHINGKIEVTTGQYFCAINSKMQFPDRSPRPQVSFSELQNWNVKCRYKTNDTVTFASMGDENKKYDLLTDWQEVLAKQWTDIVFGDHPKKNEPWFNNNLRKFIIEFLKVYDKMTSDQKQQYKEYLLNIIK